MENRSGKKRADSSTGRTKGAIKTDQAVRSNLNYYTLDININPLTCGLGLGYTPGIANFADEAIKQRKNTGGNQHQVDRADAEEVEEPYVILPRRKQSLAIGPRMMPSSVGAHLKVCTSCREHFRRKCLVQGVPI